MKARKHTNVFEVNKQSNNKNQKSCNRDNGDSMKQRVEGKAVKGRSYEAKEWKQLTENQLKALKELHCEEYQGSNSYSAANGVKLVRFSDDIESVLNDTPIAEFDAITDRKSVV